METVFGLIFIILNEIIKFCRKRPIASFLLIFVLWVNSLPLPDETIVRRDPQVERSFGNTKALKCSGGEGFINPAPSTKDFGATGAGDRGQDRFADYDPSPKIPFPGNSGGSSNSLGALSANKVPNKEDWDINEWLEDEDAGDECNDFEEAIKSDSLPVKVNFEYIRDKNGNPTLLVPNIDPTRTIKGRTFHQVQYDQTLSHLHHLPELGMQLPPGFDMEVYKNLQTKAAKIEYGKKHLSPETIISYQNTIGLRMSPLFGSGIKTYGIRGFAGKNRANVSLVLQSIPNSSDYYMSIINDRGKHVSSYPIREEKLITIVNNDFWILQERNFN